MVWRVVRMDVEKQLNPYAGNMYYNKIQGFACLLSFATYNFLILAFGEEWDAT
jgi:hypothetical protein